MDKLIKITDFFSKKEAYMLTYHEKQKSEVYHIPVRISISLPLLSVLKFCVLDTKVSSSRYPNNTKIP
jgi:hypothetical protein